MKKWLLSLFIVANSLQATPLDETMLKNYWKTPQHSAKYLVQQMSMEEKLGQMMMFDFRQWRMNESEPFSAVTTLPAPLQHVVHDYHLGSVILFRENLVTTEQSVQLINQLQAARDQLPLFITVDQEGGYVTRLQQGTEMPGNMALGATRSERLAEITGMIHGSELASMGFNWNFGPVVDVNNNQNNPVINVRSYSDHPELVIDLARSYIQGIHRYSLMTSLKHFPGHGNVATDTHFALPTIHISESEWRDVELKPFAALKSTSDSIMTAHVVVPALDDRKIKTLNGEMIGTPATLSKRILTDILRHQVGFNGLIITDAMDMGAIATYFDKHWAIKQAILAGNDIILMPLALKSEEDLPQIEALYRYLMDEAAKDPELSARINESATRVVQMKLEKQITAPMIDPSTVITHVASPLNKTIEDFVSEQAITLIKNDQNLLPYALKKENHFAIFSDEEPRNALVSRILHEIATMADVTVTTAEQKVNMMRSDADRQTIEKTIAGKDLVLLITYNLSLSPKNGQLILDIAREKAVPVVVISSRNPYDIAYLKGVSTNLAIYGITGFDVTNNVRNSLETNISSGLKTLFQIDGQPLNPPQGQLPVTIKSADGQTVLYPFGYGLRY